MTNKYDNLKDKNFEEYKQESKEKHKKHTDNITSILERISHIEGYNKGKTEATNRIIDWLLRLFPTIISIIALFFSVKK